VKTPTYDIVIAGAGLSGLSLAYHLLRSPLREMSMLVVDSEAKDRDDRTWAFWSSEPGLFDDIVHQSWNQLQTAGPGWRRQFDLGEYRYQVIRGIDFYHRAKAELATHGVTFLQGRVERIEDGPEFARVTIDDQVVAGRWVFDSLYKRNKTEAGDGRFYELKLHFVGWEIETAGAVFDPQMATLMDFRAAQEGDTRFFYILPYSERRALVEYTIFSGSALRPRAYEGAIRAYMEETLAVGEYQILRKESGCLPVTDRPFPRRLGRRIMAIGTKGGRVKPTSGYAFTRVQADSAAIVRSLQEQGHPFDVPVDAWRYRLSDSLLLQVMSENGEQIEPVFSALFRRNSIGRIFRFLDEAAGPWEQLLIIPTLPPWRFIGALWQRIWGRGQWAVNSLSGDSQLGVDGQP